MFGEIPRGLMRGHGTAESQSELNIIKLILYLTLLILTIDIIYVIEVFMEIANANCPDCKRPLTISPDGLPDV